MCSTEGNNTRSTFFPLGSVNSGLIWRTSNEEPTPGLIPRQLGDESLLAVAMLVGIHAFESTDNHSASSCSSSLAVSTCGPPFPVAFLLLWSVDLQYPAKLNLSWMTNLRTLVISDE